MDKVTVQACLRTMSQFLERPMMICFFSAKLSWNWVLNRSSAVSCLHPRHQDPTAQHRDMPTRLVHAIRGNVAWIGLKDRDST